MGKVIVVNVHCLDGVTCVTDSHFFHKDFGSRVVINGLNLETGTQVHFSLTEKSGKPFSMIGVSENGMFSVDVPDNVLNSNTKRDDYEIYAFVYCTDEDSGWTEHEIVIPVKMRPDKEFENPTSEELTAFDKVAKYVSDTAESIANDRDQINKNKEDIEYLKEHGVGGGNSGDYKLPQATETNLGGVKASPKKDNDTVEAKIGADGKLYVPTYPEQNEIPVDSALDKTSTNPVQNKAVAEAVEKLSNDKLERTELPEAVNTALAQAKESGEFDGADGTTPHIGENGNWFIGDEDTGIKAGGSGSDDKKKEWVLVFEQDIEALNEDSSNSVTYVEVTQDMDGNPLCCKAFILETRDRTKATENGYNYLNFNHVNSVRDGSFLPPMHRKGLQTTYYIGEPMDNGQRLFQLAYASDRGSQPPMHNGSLGAFGIGFAPNATNPNWGEDITKIGWGSYQNINGMLVRIYALVEG